MEAPMPAGLPKWVGTGFRRTTAAQAPGRELEDTGKQSASIVRNISYRSPTPRRRRSSAHVSRPSIPIPTTSNQLLWSGTWNDYS